MINAGYVSKSKTAGASISSAIKQLSIMIDLTLNPPGDKHASGRHAYVLERGWK